MDKLRRVVAQVEALAQPTEEPRRTHTRVRRCIVLLAQAEDGRHYEVKLLLQMLIEGLQRMEHLQRWRALLAPITLHRREQGWHERRQVGLELVTEREAELLNHFECMNLQRDA